MSQRPAIPLSSGNPNRDYARYHKALDEIFSTHFPNWGRSSAATHIAPVEKNPKRDVIQAESEIGVQSPLAALGLRDPQKTSSNIYRRARRRNRKRNYYVIYRPGKIFNAHDFRSLALKKFVEFDGEPGIFVCSHKFIRDFNRRQRFSSRRFQMRRRNTRCPET
jgi:hypothetical protein